MRITQITPVYATRVSVKSHAMSEIATPTPSADGSLLSPGRVILKPKKARPFFGRHPWVLDSAIDRVEGQPADGDVVDLLSDRNQFIARGVFNSHSRLRVRLYSWAITDRLDGAFWAQRLGAAGQLREQLGLTQPTGAVRLVSSEADGLSGLVVERYGPHLVVQILSRAMAVRLPLLIEAIVARWQPQSITLRSDREMSKFEGITLDEGLAWGQLDAGPVFIEEHGLRFGVDLRAGQKTGFYLDQRDNRRYAAELVARQRVLDVCCYSGGFALNAARGGAREVHALDSSAKAIALAKCNAQLNGISNIQFEVADCFQRLDQLRQSGERYGTVILDPPKFASSRQHAADALQAYHRLNRLAVELLEPSGWLVTCSCSGHVSREDFLYMLAGVAEKSGRTIQVVQQRGAAPDHPLSASCLEGEYLKCFTCRVL